MFKMAIVDNSREIHGLSRNSRGGRIVGTVDFENFTSLLGLYINYVILFWTILNTPLPPVIMSSFDIPPTPPDDAIYVQDNH